MKEEISKGFGIASLVMVAMFFANISISFSLLSSDSSDEVFWFMVYAAICSPFVALILAVISVRIRKIRIGIIALYSSIYLSVVTVIAVVFFHFVMQGGMLLNKIP
jgi:hypothetical protein